MKYEKVNLNPVVYTIGFVMRFKKAKLHVDEALLGRNKMLLLYPD